MLVKKQILVIQVLNLHFNKKVMLQKFLELEKKKRLHPFLVVMISCVFIKANIIVSPLHISFVSSLFKFSPILLHGIKTANSLRFPFLSYFIALVLCWCWSFVWYSHVLFATIKFESKFQSIL